MYEWASETLEAHGFAQYEISNWARPDFECSHNLQYWRNLPYLGLGAGAHGYAAGWRYSVVRSPRGYVERISKGRDVARNVSTTVSTIYPFSPAVAERHEVDRAAEMGETMMVGMRLIGRGVSECEFRDRFGVGLAEQFGRKLKRLSELKLIEWDAAGTRLTKNGRLVANRVFREFV